MKTHDRFGNRLDIVEYHPAYHELMRIALENETHSLSWTSQKSGKYVARSALAYLKQQVDEGTSCPVTMTFAVVPSLKISEEIADFWLPKVLSNEYDERFLPASEKRGATFGMAMTEPQGGSDVRANITFAEKFGDTGEYKITGRKWFCSAPMSDAFLVLAQTAKGLSCFLNAAFYARRRSKQIIFSAFERQTRQSFKCFGRSRISRGVCKDHRRRRTRRGEYYGNGAPHAARLRGRLCRNFTTRRWRKAFIIAVTEKRSANFSLNSL